MPPKPPTVSGFYSSFFRWSLLLAIASPIIIGFYRFLGRSGFPPLVSHVTSAPRWYHEGFARLMAHSGPAARRMPVYFLSIGGPNTVENVDHPAYKKLEQVGLEITQKVKPKAVVVFSAHWQPQPDTIEINVGENEDIIYDFNGFPPHYYEYKFPNKGNRALAETIAEKFGNAGIPVRRVKRGLDHGIWAGFIPAFNPKTNPLNVPIVQVSLYDNEDVDSHFQLGQVLEGLRDDGVLIVGAGMAVHNLWDYRRFRGTGGVMPYTTTFDSALKDACTADPQQRRARMASLIDRSDARKAHPSLEHIMPAYIAAGAAGRDPGQQIWTMTDGSLSWAQYRFGAVAGN